ncbi:SGNH/GDSL hydrolase family protein [Peribacillus saganii]|uniref:SGNH/GDSL hydrolase family protein n=1 Tax=Peribacillus saganii TaxID=2303992 RepID=UPI001F17A662|nr:SGNH/GDSL hydrolase family protein [Peribacillus saganii]
MNRKSVVSFTVFSALLTLILIFSLSWALYDYYRAAPQPIKASDTETAVQTRENEAMTIIALGDSLTRGTGDETGRGYVGIVSEQLKRDSDKQVIIHNIGINGQRSAQLKEQVKKQEIQRQIGMADAVLITIGGNDLFQGGQTLMNIDPKEIEKAQNIYSANIQSIFETVRSINSEAAIYLIGLYNPFIELEDSELTTRAVTEWNQRSAELSSEFPRTIFVPTFDLFQLNVNDYLFSDKFHPNRDGYKMIADRVAALLSRQEGVK